MITGIISLIFDYFILKYIGYYIDSVIIFPMFTFIFLLSSLYFNKDIKVILLIFYLYLIITGIVFLPLLILFINNIVKRKNDIDNYLITISISLILYDLLFYLFLSLNNISLLINKIIVTIPINILYSLIIYYVLKKNYGKYKLLW